MKGGNEKRVVKSFSVNDLARKDRQSNARRSYLLLYQQIRDALQSGAANFVLAYNVRAGIGVALRIFQLIKAKRIDDVLNLSKLLGETHLKFRVDAVSLGLFVGWFSGGYKALESILDFVRTREDGWNSFVAGAIASLAVLFVNKDRRRTLALYVFVRAIQCGYNAAKARGLWHFWGSSWPHGDALLFALSSAQVMYAYVMRPSTLPMSYYNFIVSCGPVRRPVLSFVKKCNRGEALDPSSINSFLGSLVVHADSSSCSAALSYAFSRACRKTFPLYVSLHIVPTAVLRLKRSLSRPLLTLYNALMGATRSTIFVGTFVSLYQAVICVHRKICVRENKLLWYFAGLVASTSILMEQKQRRSELALYVLPRAADSVFMIMEDRRLLSGMPFGDVLLFCMSMGSIMYCYQNEPSNVSPFLYRLLRRFVHPTVLSSDS